MRDLMDFRANIKPMLCLMTVLGGLLLGSSLVMAQVNPSSKEAGKVLMAIGEVKRIHDGQTTPLLKGAIVEAGDTIETGIASNAQLRMTDGAVIALRAQTNFKINEYQFNGKADGSEKASLSLIKGGIRAVTGVIGKGENKDNLQVNAVVATVGIRGTGFNLNYCEGNCVNKDKSPAKNGLYAGVFEGQILVKNQAATQTLDVDEYLYVADKDSRPIRLRQAPNFLPDPLLGQKSVKPKGRTQSTDIASLNISVNPPSSPADTVVSGPSSPYVTDMGVVVNPSPYLASGTPYFYPSTIYNTAADSNGQLLTTGSSTYYLQSAETNPYATSSVDGLPLHSITTGANVAPPSLAVSYANSGSSSQTATISQIILPYPTYIVTGTTNVPVAFSLLSLNYPAVPYAVPVTNPAQQIEGGNFDNIIAWGRWANGNIIIADYNNGQPIYLPANNGFHYIVGDLTNATTLQNYVSTPGNSVLNFTLLAGTTPTAILPVAGSTWALTGGSMTANFASAQLNGNLNLYTNQPSGYGTFNMGFSSSLLSAANASNNVSVNAIKTSGTTPLCTAGCGGAGTVSFYGGNNAATLPAQAAGLTYNFNTGNNVVQGTAVFKR